MKKIAMFIAFQGFRDEEYIEPKSIFEKAEIQVDTISTARGIAKGKLGALAEVNMRISEINVPDYAALCLVGGPGCLEHLDNPEVYEIFRRANDLKKIIGAICISPVVLTHAGLLKGKRATVWYEGADELKNNGVIYTAKDVEKDGNIITANGPTAAVEFARTLLEEIK